MSATHSASRLEMSPPAPAVTDRRSVAAMLVLTVAVLLVYGQVFRFGFVEFDDPGYVSENPYVAQGLSWEAVGWACTTGHMWNWSPVTWLSYLLDVQLFGVNAGGHHLVNLAFHLANTWLLFAFLLRTTRALSPSFIVAALFALHPLHVESVAWISERKDVLSTFFFFLTLWTYVSYVASRSRAAYAASLFVFALGLMAKSMLVTVPFVLLLIDLWPLQRFATVRPGSRVPRPGFSINPGPRTRDSGPTAPTRIVPIVLGEKIPFLLLSLAASAVTFLVQRANGAMNDTAVLPMWLRVANAMVSYVRYLAMTVWPVNLAVFYPYDLHLPIETGVIAGVCVIGISSVALWLVRTHPYVTVGWFWYLGMLVPVIGLVQVGSQAFADRYTYVPLIGVFIALAWGGRAVIARWSLPVSAVMAAVAAVIVTCAVVAFAQVRLWQSGETLLDHAVRVTHGNYLAHNNLGVALAAQGKTDAAIEHYREALRLQPDYEHARLNLAKALLVRYEAAVAARPDDAAARYDLATALRDAGRLQEARDTYVETIRLDPNHAAACRDLGTVLVGLGDILNAITQLEHAARLLPDDATLWFNLGSTLARAGRFSDAVERYQRTIALTPNDAEAWGNLAMAYAELGNDAEVARAERQAVALARAQAKWALVSTLEEWHRSYVTRVPRSHPGESRDPGD